jgi:hypothetical protein
VQVFAQSAYATLKLVFFPARGYFAPASSGAGIQMDPIQREKRAENPFNGREQIVSVWRIA